MRPNCFVNTPDINPFFLQSGNKAAFAIRATLAALLAPTYGVYAGFEVFEHKALAPGKEEYLDSEKFQYRPRDWAAASHTSLVPYLTMLNQIRRDHPALHELRNLRFEQIDNSQMIAWSKRHGDDVVVVACVLDPNSPQAGVLHLDLAALGFGADERVVARDLITDQTWAWGADNYIRLRPEFHLCTRRRPGEDVMTPSNTPADPGKAEEEGTKAEAEGDRSAGWSCDPAGQTPATSTGSSTAPAPARTRSWARIRTTAA